MPPPQPRLLPSGHPRQYSVSGASPTMTILGQSQFTNYREADVGDLIVVFAKTTTGTIESITGPNDLDASNPWQPIGSADYGNGGPKVRAWWKKSTTFDRDANRVYTFGLGGNAGAVGYFVIYGGSFDPNDPFPIAAAPWAGLTAPVQVTVTTITGDGPVYSTETRHGADLSAMNLPTLPRSKSLLIGIYSGTTVMPGGHQDYPQERYEGIGTATGSVLAAPVTTDGRARPAFHLFSGILWGGSGTPYATLSFLIAPMPEPAWPTPGIGARTLVDPFDTLPSAEWTLYNDGAGGAYPSISGGQLLMPGRTALRRATRVDLRENTVVFEAVDVRPEGEATQFQLSLWSIIGDSANGIVAATTMVDSSTAGAVPVIFLRSFYYGIPYTSGLHFLDPAVHRWWRLRVTGGLLILDTADSSTGEWITRLQLVHQLDDGALQSMEFGLDNTFTRSYGPMMVDNLNTVQVSDVVDPVPSQRTMDWLRAGSPGARHGRDTLVAVIDSGTTADARDHMGYTLEGRATFLSSADQPPAGQEIFPGWDHGVQVAACAVPRGGRLLDVIIAGLGGTTDQVKECAALRYCAEQGATVINLSFGGPGDIVAQIFHDTFTYIRDNFDCQIFVSAGNSGGALESPASYSPYYSNLHAVGAADERTSTRAAFSCYSSDMAGLAPGVAVRTLTPNAKARTSDGTSFSSPLAASLCARLIGPTVTPTQAWDALAATRRTLTGVPAVEQGGGAFDFAAAKVMLYGIEPGAAGAPGAATAAGQSAQVVSGALVPVSTWNRLAQDIDDLGLSTSVRRTATKTIPANVEELVTWQAVSYATRPGGWAVGSNPERVTITAPGRYLVVAHVRFGAPGGSGSGLRAARIVKNATTLEATRDWDQRAGSVLAAGVTIRLRTVEACVAGDWFAVSIASTVAVTGLHTDRGGTHLFVCRIGGVGFTPTASGELGAGPAALPAPPTRLAIQRGAA